MKAPPDETMTTCGVTLNRVPVCRRMGRRRTVSSSVEMTLTVTMVSWPSDRAHSKVRTLALLRSTSSLSSLAARAANSLTLSKEERSSCQTSTTPWR